MFFSDIKLLSTKTIIHFPCSRNILPLLLALYQSWYNKNSQTFLANSVVLNLFKWNLYSFKCLEAWMSRKSGYEWEFQGVHMWAYINNIDTAYGPVNCFDATGNLIIVIECKIGAFFKKKCWLLGHI